MSTRVTARPLTATRIGLPARATVVQRPPGTTVLSTHRQVVNLMAPGGDLLALVAPAIGAGPFNIVLNHWPSAMMNLTPGMAVEFTPSALRVGTWHVNLAAASLWQPEPDWADVAQAPALEAGIETLRRCLLDEPTWPLARQLDHVTAQALWARIEVVNQASTNSAQADALAALIGLGPGLTPAGDDWLAGWLVRWHLAAATLAAAATLSPPLRVADLTSTTRLSQALLRAARAGWVDEAWEGLLAALAANEAVVVQRQARLILQHGATSGCAMLAGFLRSL